MWSRGNSGRRRNAAVVLFNFMVVVVLQLYCSSMVSVVMAARGSKVDHIPGLQYDGPLPFELETGYIGVGENEEVQVFYYFVKSQTNPTTDPFIFWKVGGPGCSALFAIIQEIGPISMEVVKYTGGMPKLKLNPHTWTKVSNMLFIDLPARAGFTYATTKKANVSSNMKESEQAYEFMRKWFNDHPEYLTNPFYVGGDSFSGLTVPIITKMIADGNEAGTKPLINLKGYILGNPASSLNNVHEYRIPAAYGMNLIPTDLYKSLEKNCKGNYDHFSNELCAQDMGKFDQLTRGINPTHILEDFCIRVGTGSDGLRRSLSQRPVLPPGEFCWQMFWYLRSDLWANNVAVQDALHVRKGTIGRWCACNYTDIGYTADMTDALPYHANLTTRGLRALIYSGDHDLIVPTMSTEAWITSLNYSTVDSWRPWAAHDGIIAGFTRSYSNNMTFATLKGSGHIAPFFSAYECLIMFERWISGQKL
ncbi:PREDICTED: serine carboxypeptidase-like 13 [Ipomoea nil]|uniref:serine carboxypeptidase-like 13 n=1 Tax=Ipomoea nil TaxID=35883 RepID=UPI00090084E9|nr:PREDICTED: serine carboxypeptidase-like 13 [Ipomoea nil]